MDKGTISFMSKSITQDMAYRQSLMKYAEKYNVSRASRKYNRSRQRGYTRRPESLFRVMRKLGAHRLQRKTPTNPSPTSK